MTTPPHSAAALQAIQASPLTRLLEAHGNVGSAEPKPQAPPSQGVPMSSRDLDDLDDHRLAVYLP
jgi:hypothetical protein